MHDIQLFNFDNYKIRVVEENNITWFVAKDVCEALDISNVSLAVNGRERIRQDGNRYWSGGLEDDEKGIVSVNTPGGVQGVLCVNEPGVYALVFQSRKPEAKAFKRWVMHDVIPTIRRTGAYVAPTSNVVPLSKDQALVTVLRTTADLVEQQEELRRMVTSQAEELKTIRATVSEQITLDSGEQRKLQKAIARRVYDLDLNYSARQELFRQLYREIKDRWAVPSYKDVRRSELSAVLRYIDAWQPRIA